jgi:hypothetical protein
MNCLPPQACCSLNEDTTESLLCLPTLRLSLPGASGNATENHDHLDVCIMMFPEILGKLLYYLHLPSRANDLSGESWKLITSIHDEGDGLTLCEQHS